MKALIEAELFRQMERDRHRKAAARADRRSVDMVVIREASAEDSGRLHRLSLLDSAPNPHGPMLVAERDGLLVAAVPLGGGRAIADPFEATAGLIGLLELRRSQLRPA
ncbi:MAG TPA: hypothetical protein VH247_02940 [Thermoleophilaceae bacterium]|nr:hypothetical protein [Thermoleophilaceae bacterium]